MKPKMRLLAAIAIAAASPLAFAQTTGGTATGGTTTGGTVTTTTNAGQTLVATKIASNFTNLAGSTDNALALVNALRTGTDVTLTSTAPPPEGSTEPPTTTTTTFTPPTGKMGWGEVKHALALAQDSLARAGVTNPTAEQLQAALVGGDITTTNADGTTKTTTLKGVLTLRAGGMGWGNIAKAGGTKLGPVTSKVKMGNNAPATTTTTAAGDVAPLTGKSKGVTTAAGMSAASGPSKGITTAVGASSGAPGLVTAEGASVGHTPKGNAYGRGIVTAAGGGGVNVAANGNGHGKPIGVGIVTAGGGSATAVTTATNHAGGNGNGNAGGNGKGNGKGAGPGG
ncbi:MAG TPA: hypothetical protein VFU92_06060 [Usitatibacter sp.]|nr:hypothetical protein [Usitatibacter sp.]